jgi:sugar (pentulose or hexulose) kinase
LGVGVDGPGPLSVALGTSGVVFAALPAFASDPEARVHAFCHAVPGGWHAMGVMLSAAGSLRWLRDAVGGEYAALTAEAERRGVRTYPLATSRIDCEEPRGLVLGYANASERELREAVEVLAAALNQVHLRDSCSGGSGPPTST